MDNHKIPEKILLQSLQQNLQHLQTAGGGATTSPPARSDSVSSSIYSDDSTSSRPSSPSSSTHRHNDIRIFRAQEAVTNFLISTDPNFQALHDALIIQLLLIALFTLVRDSYSAGSLFLDTSFFRISAIGNVTDLSNFVLTELSILIWGFIVHPVFKVWAYCRSTVRYPRAVDVVFVLLYLTHLLIGIYSTIYVLAGLELLPRIATLIASIEQFRITMKSYSFIRENAYKVLYPWHKDDTTGPAVWFKGQMSPRVGSFSQYCYFLFAPTLLYRDHYPRTAGIRWNAVIMYAIQMFVGIWCAAFIATTILFPSSLSEQDVLHCFMLSLIMGLVALMLGSIVVLHAHMNLAAELMCFADRKFYDTWWTCASFSSFYRKWNLIVHDWIHSYIYLDMRKIFSKRIAVFCTIFVSSLVHEYLLAMGVGFVLPILTVLFAGFGVFFYILKPLENHRTSNLFILTCLSTGTAIIITILLIEAAAREYCPKENRSWFVPQLISCYSAHNYGSNVTHNNLSASQGYI